MSVDVYTEHGTQYYLSTLDAPDGAKVRHAASFERPSPFPGNWTLIWEAFVLMCLQVRAGYKIAQHEFLERAEPLKLQAVFVSHWIIYIAPNKIERVAVSLANAAKNEETHQSIRRSVITASYAVVGFIIVASAPKVLMLIWGI